MLTAVGWPSLVSSQPGGRGTALSGCCTRDRPEPPSYCCTHSRTYCIPVHMTYIDDMYILHYCTHDVH